LTTGGIDSSYATNGIAQIAFSPGVATSNGINIANNGKTVISGVADIGLGNCATARLNVDGSPDITFNLTGHAVLDVDSGVAPNYLLRFTAIGQKRYIGYGGSVRNSKNEFMIARFHDVAESSVRSENTASSFSLQIIPNPVNRSFTVQTSGGVSEITIIDALGRERMRIDQHDEAGEMTSTPINASSFVNGLYYCLVKRGTDQIVEKFIVAH
jgi:hypothetical protein